MADWLEDTYRRSFDLCPIIDENRLRALAETMAVLHRHFGDDEITASSIYKDFMDPFLSNVRKDEEHLIHSAAKATGVKIQVGEPKLVDDPNLIGVYLPGPKRDLSSFWEAFQALKKVHA